MVEKAEFPLPNTHSLSAESKEEAEGNLNEVLETLIRMAETTDKKVKTITDPRYRNLLAEADPRFLPALISKVAAENAGLRIDIPPLITKGRNEEGRNFQRLILIERDGVVREILLTGLNGEGKQDLQEFKNGEFTHTVFVDYTWPGGKDHFLETWFEGKQKVSHRKGYPVRYREDQPKYEGFQEEWEINGKLVSKREALEALDNMGMKERCLDYRWQGNLIRKEPIYKVEELIPSKRE